jgi:hypothetical protein
MPDEENPVDWLTSASRHLPPGFQLFSRFLRRDADERGGRPASVGPVRPAVQGGTPGSASKGRGGTASDARGTGSVPGIQVPGGEPGALKGPTGADGKPTRSEQDRMANSPAWTMALHLGTNMGTEAGAQAQFQQISRLVAATRGKPIVFVVQALKPPKTLDDLPVLERYIVRNGQMDKVAERPARSYASEVEELVAIAGKEAGTGRMGIVLQSHGVGAFGLDDDAPGEMSLQELRTAIRGGLSTSGRSKVDTLSLNACLMGQAEVLNAVSGLSDHLLASADVEWSEVGADGSRVDGMPIPTLLETLIQQPGLTAEGFMAQAIQRADRGTPTLSYFDMARYPGLQASLHAFAAALERAGQDPVARPVLRDIIERMAPYGADVVPEAERSSPDGSQRDLGHFVTEVMLRVKDGQLPDPNGELLRTSRYMATHISDLVVHHRQTVSPRDKQRDVGLGIFLPARAFFEADTVRQTPLFGGLRTQFDELRAEGIPRDLRDLQARRVRLDSLRDFIVERVVPGVPADQRAAFTPLFDTMRKTRWTDDPAAWQQGLDQAIVELDGLARGPLGDRVRQLAIAHRATFVHQTIENLRPLSPSDAWMRFVASLDPARDPIQPLPPVPDSAPGTR